MLFCVAGPYVSMFCLFFPSPLYRAYARDGHQPDLAGWDGGVEFWNRIYLVNGHTRLGWGLIHFYNSNKWELSCLLLLISFSIILISPHCV